MAVTTSWLGKLKKLLGKTRGTELSRVEIEYDAGFGNTLFIRGEGAMLKWDQGAPLKNEKTDLWVWETTSPFESCRFKILINDVQYEIGENHSLTYGGTIRYTPKF